MTTEKSSLLHRIVAGARALTPRQSVDATTIRGIWRVEYAIRLNPTSSAFHLRHVCIETNGIGSATYADDTEVRVIDDSLIGSSIMELAEDPRPLLIAGMDALYGNVVREPDEVHMLSGTGPAKALARAEIVCDEVLRLARDLHPKQSRIKIVNVGVVGDFLHHLRSQSKFALEATDFSDALIGKTLHDVVVRGGRSSGAAVAKADIALITGMALSTNTLDGLLRRAKVSGTIVVIFAQTGANFAEVYLREGAATVIAEPYPFYLSGTSTCTIKVYRSSHFP